MIADDNRATGCLRQLLQSCAIEQAAQAVPFRHLDHGRRHIKSTSFLSAIEHASGFSLA
jgi:hypothetical protein